MSAEHPSVGRRVWLVFTSNEHTKLKPGARGTVTHVDDAGVLHVAWDDGGHELGLIPGRDRWIEEVPL